jgi:hypothetical protein
MRPQSATGPHPYLRAYMAGITIPTAFLLVILAVFVAIHQVYQGPLPVDRVLVFPMAIAPNLWGAWNMLYVAIRRRRHWPLGTHGVLLALIVGPSAWSIAHALACRTRRWTAQWWRIRSASPCTTWSGNTVYAG